MDYYSRVHYKCWSYCFNWFPDLFLVHIYCRFLCCPVMCIYVRISVLWCSLRFPHKNEVRFVSTSSCLYDASCLIYVICVHLRIVVSNAYCVVFLFCFSSSCVPYVASFSGLSIFDCPFGILLRLLFHFSKQGRIQHSSSHQICRKLSIYGYHNCSIVVFRYVSSFAYLMVVLWISKCTQY